MRIYQNVFITLALYFSISNIYALNILVVTTYFPAHEGRFILNQIIGLIDAGHDVTIFAKYKGPETYHPLIDEYHLWEKLIIDIKPKNITQYDVILCQFGYRGAECANWLKRIPRANRPLLATCFRGADISKFVKQNPHLYDTLFEIGDLFLPVCNFFKKKLIKLGCPREKIKILHSGIDCNAFYFAPKKWNPNEPIIITSVCRLVEKKGIEYVIDALSQLVIEYPHIQYWIVGDGPLKESLMLRVHKLNLEDHVTFWGRQSETMVIDILHKSHIFILPSITAKTGDIEGIPNALKEAMACGVPVIATDHAGNSELIQEDMGIIIPEKDTSALITAVRYTLDRYKNNLLNAQIKNARIHVIQKYDMHAVNNLLMSLLAQ